MSILRGRPFSKEAVVQSIAMMRKGDSAQLTLREAIARGSEF